MLAALAMPGWPAGAQVAGPPPAAPGAALQPGPVITLVTGERGQLAGPGPGHADVVSPGGPAGPRSLMIVGTERAAYLIPAAARAGRDGRLAFAAGFPARSGPGEYTLTIRGTNRFGRPDTGDVVDLAKIDQSKPVAELTFRHGIARVKVPAGHYWAIGDFRDFFDARHPVPDERLVTLPQFTVTGNTTIRLSERAATSKVTMSTPRPAVPADTTVELARSGTGDYFEFLDIGYSIWVNPTRVRPSIGRPRVYTSQQLVSPPGARGVPYAYYLSFRGPEGIIPRQHFTIRPAGLATVHDRFFQDSRATAVLQRSSFFPAQLRGLLLEASLPLRLPRRQTEYLTGNPAILWTDSLRVASPASLASVSGLMRVFRAGQHLNEDWDADPLSPQPNLRPAGPQLAQPSAARAGNLLRLAIAPFSDGQPGHAGPQFAAGRYAVDQDGRQVAGGQLGPNPGSTASTRSASPPPPR